MRQTYKSYNASAIERIAIIEHYAPMIMAPSSKIFKNNKTQKYSYLYYMFNVHVCMHARIFCMHVHTYAFMNRTSDTNSIPPIQSTHAPT